MNTADRNALNSPEGEAAALAMGLRLTLLLLTPEEARAMASELVRAAYAVERARDDGMPDAYAHVRRVVQGPTDDALRLSLRIGRTD